MKKAKEITVLCDAEVSLVIFSSNGKMSDYYRYQTTSGNKLWDAKHEYLSAEVDRVKKENDNMRMQLRHLNGEDLNSLHPKELIPIESALEDGVAGVIAKQASSKTNTNLKERFRSLKKRIRMLDEENKRLNYTCQQQDVGIDTSNLRSEMDNGAINGYNSQKAAEATRDFQFVFLLVNLKSISCSAAK
ncbi:hypothetical protein MKW94_012720 [Papaver nudicaule]|uniref:PISTILLATA-like protein n=1 Tax=Papaver nudicaule TaxID=74823 RepID=A0AA41S0I7_PAPNU|nr:hypothetical protein [Papaver nudicaule]